MLTTTVFEIQNCSHLLEKVICVNVKKIFRKQEQSTSPLAVMKKVGEVTP